MAKDLYRSRAVGGLLRNPLPQRLLNWALLMGLAALMFVAWGMERLPGVPDPFPLLYTNAATLLFWVFWFMGLVLLAPVAGRAWCSVCPLGFVSDRLGRIGLDLGWPGGAWKWLGVLGVFVAGVFGALFLDAHKSPHLTALLVGGMLAFAALTGLVWKRAAFCRLFCPVGLVLNIYGRFSPFKVACVSEEKCKRCSIRSCTDRRPVWKRWDVGSLVVQKKIFRAGCPVALDPPTMDGAECLLCMECVRNCSEDNLGVFYGLRTSRRELSKAAVILLVPLAGLVCLALVRTWPVFRDAVTPGAFPPVWAWAAWLGLFVPALLILGPSAVQYFSENASGRRVSAPADGVKPARVGHEERRSFWKTAGRMAAPLAGPVLGAHMALALVKLNAKAAYLPYLLYDPTGTSTYMAMNQAGTLKQPGLVVPLSVLGPVALSLLAVGAVLGLMDGWKTWRDKTSATASVLAWTSFAALTCLYGALIFHWLLGGR